MFIGVVVLGLGLCLEVPLRTLFESLALALKLLALILGLQ